MRKLILIIVVVTAAGIAIAAAATGRSDGSNQEAARPQTAQPPAAEVSRVASALGLVGADRAALARAQALGHRATECLLAHGARQGAAGGVEDATGAATAACTSEIEANEAFLSSATFKQVLRAAQPKFDAAARCFTRVSGLPAGKAIHTEDLSADLQRRINQAEAQCFRPDGLPR
jgi:hypothetical protein